MFITLAQMNFKVGDIVGNLQKILYCTEQALQQNSDLIIFPELALTGYPPEDLLLRPELYQQVEQAIETLLSKHFKIGILVGLPIYKEQCSHNAAFFIYKDKILGAYYKQLLPNYHVFDERRYFVPGNAPCVIKFKGVKIGISICEDAWEPEPLKKTKAAGAEIVININASPFHIGKQTERLSVLRQRITENHLPLIYLNLIGGQDELIFDGQSMVLDDQGELIITLPFCQESFKTIQLVPPFVKGGQGEIFLESQENLLYEALKLSVREYVIKNGFRGAIVGLSGGVDSALTAVIAADALGREHITTVMMPSRYTSKMSLQDAAKLAKTLGVSHHVISIEPFYEQAVLALNAHLDGLPHDITLQNLQSRCRGLMLMAISNETGKLVLTTGNKSELAVGYCTLYGDTAGAFCVLKDLVKTRVYALANYRNQISWVIPKRILERAPSAELAHNQTDQDTLPPYEALDKILMAYVEENKSAAEIIAEGFPPDTVYDVLKRISQNEYKRFQTPPGPRVTHRAFGKDWRYPLTNGFKSRVC